MSSVSETRHLRTRMLSERGQNIYDDIVTSYHNKLSPLKQEIDLLLNADTGDMQEHLKRLQQVHVTFTEVTSDFCDYLIKVRSRDSERELACQRLIESAIYDKVFCFLSVNTPAKHMSTVQNPSVTTPDIDSVSQSKSKVTRSSRSSTSSSGSSTLTTLLLKTKAKAERSKVRLKFIKQEAELARKEADLQVDRSILHTQRKADEAEAELKAVMEYAEGSSLCAHSLPVKKESKPEKQTRIEHFVAEQNTALKESFNNGIPDSRQETPEVEPVVNTETIAPNAKFELTPLPQTRFRPQRPSDLDPAAAPYSPNKLDRPYIPGFYEPQIGSRATSTPYPTYECSASVNYETPRVPTSAATFGQGMGKMTCSDEGSPSGLGVAYDECTLVCPRGQPTSPSVRELGNSAPLNSGTSDTILRHNTPPVLSSQQPYLEMCSVFTKYMAKKDLLLLRFTKFDDVPEHFRTWKASFRGIVDELIVSPLEEIDLLVKWLGPESSNFALTLRAANAGNPENGVRSVWERLEDMYGSPEMVEASIKRKLSSFQRIASKDHGRLFELSDIVSEIASLKEDPKYSVLLAYYDSSSGVNPIVSKLPVYLQEKWTTEAVKYKEKHKVSYPPFSHFNKFMRELARVKNDPSYEYDFAASDVKKKEQSSRTKVISRKTDTNPKLSEDTCPLHKAGHLLNKCRSFRSKPIKERKDFLFSHGICFKCCGPREHMAKDCTSSVKCEVCGSTNHPSAMHVETKPNRSHGGEGSKRAQRGGDAFSKKQDTVVGVCTQICGQRSNTSKSCGKIVLAQIYHVDHPENSCKLYVILDDQSNRTLGRSSVFNFFHEEGPDQKYTMSSCSGSHVTTGRVASGYVIESVDGSFKSSLPDIIECDAIPNMREEIPSPEVAKHFPHLQDLEGLVPPIDSGADIALLIGRDLPVVHHVLDQRIGGADSPFAQKLHLGWVVIGETCLGSAHGPDVINVNKVNTLRNGRPSLLQPCPNNLDLSFSEDALFRKTPEDNKPGLSINDKRFLEIMESKFRKDVEGNWIAPLPFKLDKPRLPDNRSFAVKRAKSLEASMRRDPRKKEHMVEFMQKILDKGHAEVAPELTKYQERWYLPLFGVYNPKKPDTIRGVFDSSAKYENVSLNDVLLSGPDSANSLLGVLLRFRKEPVALTADIEHMFYCFRVEEKHRDYLRFLWHKDNDPDLELIEYRMTVHVFGNSPSPAVATFGLRKTVEEADPDVREFVSRNFYVDDGLVSTADAKIGIDLMKRTQSTLACGGNLRLHKITSNSTEVLEAFPPCDLAKTIKGLELGKDLIPLQKSLGLVWNVNDDTFTFQVCPDVQPYTRRGVLSTVNSLFDPLGIIAPVVIKGKLLLRDLMAGNSSSDWDDPLPPDRQIEWEAWRRSLTSLADVKIPRVYSTSGDVSQRDLLTFADASKDAIAAVSYLKTSHVDGAQELRFVLGKAKVAPHKGHTIPRLELCAAVLAVEIAQTASEQLDLKLDSKRFYTDSQVVLGYIHNEERRFYVYVSNRVEKIRAFSSPDQWSHISTDQNPADVATRSAHAKEVQDSPWVQGPKCNETGPSGIKYPLLHSETDKEIRPDVKSLKTATSRAHLGGSRFQRFSSWDRLIRAVSLLKYICRVHSSNQGHCQAWYPCNAHKSPNMLQEAEYIIIRAAQYDLYSIEIECLKNQREIPSSSSLLPLSPFLDDHGILRVGGRLNRSKNFSDNEVNPVIIPKGHHIATLIVRHHHHAIQHQGRSFTEGAVRAAGFWIIGGKRLISSLLRGCVKCRKLRGRLGWQKMADLPTDRFEPCPPFTCVGVDTFGPWEIVARRTRGGLAQAKRWAILFSCLVTRAVHIEVVEELSTSAFINALRRFIAIRGPVRQFRSDRGTNFVGAVRELDIQTVLTEKGPVYDFLSKNRSTWVFNPPHSSHMGGSWERMIGVSRRILDAMLLGVDRRNLTHDVLTTFFAEVCAIINSRPLTAVPSDPENPSILTPAMLLSHKTGTVDFDFSHMELKDTYLSTWKHVQHLANQFWKRWRREYLSGLQIRQKWQTTQPDIGKGDIVLMKDAQCGRHEWPLGVIDRIFSGDDGHVRKVELSVVREGQRHSYVRPISEVVVLLRK